MKVEEQVIWESFIMRRDRDLDRLWQEAQAGNSLAGKFFDGFGEWRKKCWKEPSAALLCLAREHAFCNPLQPPLTYLVTYSEDPRIDPGTIILTGVCWRCADKSDTDLLKLGADLTAKLLKGRVLGWCDHPVTQATS